MPQTNQDPEVKETQGVTFTFREEQTQPTRTNRAGGAQGERYSTDFPSTPANTKSNLLWPLFYLLMIFGGLFLGRWLDMRNPKPASSPAAQAIATAEQSTTQGSASGITSTGFTCPAPQYEMPVASTELNMLVWTEYFPSDWFECYEMRYGVKVNRTEYSSNEEMLEKLATSNVHFDLIQPSDQGVLTLVGQGKLAELDRERLPVFANFNQAFLNPPFDPGNKYTIPYQVGSIALAVNSAAVKSAPKSWADLWNPEYKGRLLMLEEPRNLVGVTLLSMGYPFNSTDPAHLAAIKDRLAELVQATKSFNSDDQSSEILDGSIEIGMFWNGEAALAQRENSAIQYVYPTEGAILWQDNYALPIDAQHSDAAYAWINYTMQGDLFWMMLRDFPYTNPNQSALDFAKSNYPDLYNEYMNSSSTNVPAQVMISGHWLTDLGEAQPLYDQLWAEVAPKE